jgi:hypothetical protein
MLKYCQKRFFCLNKNTAMNKWKIQKFLNLATTVILSILLYTCDTTENDIVTDPRKFNWSLDTLLSPRTDQSGRFDIWGSSITDVYTVGDVDAGGSQMWHYDGNSWKFVSLQINQGGPLAFPFSLFAIEGFRNVDIYAGGVKLPNYPEHNSLIIHFNGIEWKEIITSDIGDIGNLSKINASELYAGSLSKSYLHFNGTNWAKDSVNIFTPPNALMRITDFGEYNNDIYCLYEYQTEDATLAVHYFLKKNTNSWAIVDSFIIDQTHYTYGWGTHLKTISGANFYCFGSSPLLRYSGNSWITILNEERISDIDGQNDNNFFAVAYPGKVFHYNGTDWYEIPQLNNPTLRYTGVWFKGEEAFICGYTDGYPEKSIVWHGKN